MRIITAADDFGFDLDTYNATADLLQRGVLTSASIMARMGATEEAIRFARSHGECSFGVHLALVGDGHEYAMCPHSRLPHLTSEDGRLRRLKAIKNQILLRQIPQAEFAIEAEAQIGFLVDNGVRLSYLDSHCHAHKFPAVQSALRPILKRFGIKRVRTVQNIYLASPYRSPSFYLGVYWRYRIAQSFETTEGFYMPTNSRDPNWEVRLPLLLRHGTVEVGIHPGYTQEWRNAERVALESFCQWAASSGHVLTGWKDL